MISVVIPAYKNTQELLENLENNLPYLEGCEVIVVNDDPKKSIKEELSVYKNIILIENNVNMGFGESVNGGVRKSTGQYLLLLNSDVLLHDKSFQKILKQFEKDKNLFAVSFAQKEKSGQIVGKNVIFFSNGFFQHEKAKDTQAGETAWAEGGSCLIDRAKFETLGGFDDLYSPFYWEDIDLSYRAWKAGYTVLFDPTITVTHYHGSTIDKYFKSVVRQVAYRNQFIFIWKNIQSPALVNDHRKSLPKALLSSILRGDLVFLKGFLAARKLKSVIATRINHMKSYQKLSDEEVLRIFNHE